MKKIKLFLMAVKIEYTWVLIRILRKKRENLSASIEKNIIRERQLKCNAFSDGRSYENLSGLRDAA